MDDRSRKISCISPAEMAPPLLIRRRLSAPETIMRKYTLAQQRSLSQDSARSQNSDSTQSCNWPSDNGETVSIRKKEVDIRKSTLMKRFWENSKSFQFPRTYSEWQYSIGKMKLSSSLSTPDHLRGSRKSVFETSPKQKSVSPSQAKCDTTHTLTNSKSSKKIEENLKNYQDSEESLLIYSSNFTNVTSTDNNIEDGQQTPTTNKSLSSSTSLDPNSSSVYDEAQTTNLDLTKKYQFVIKETVPNSKMNDVQISNETYTSEGTNLNVISNVELSTSTLNLIYNQIMQDVVNKNIKSPKSTIINVQNLPSPNFQINKEVSPNRINQISEVNIGSPYKNKTPPLVPRLSAIPQTASMEVNTSSNESVDKESDTSSLLDSLEDQTSPKEPRFNHDEKVVRGELALLPDNSDNGKAMQIKKSSVFYIPMKNEEENLIKEANAKNNVSSLLPQKLKEKLLKRQIKLEEKTKEIRMRSFERISDHNNGFSFHHQYPTKNKMKKQILPLLENKKEIVTEKNFKSLHFQQSSSKVKETDFQSNEYKAHLPKARPLGKHDNIIPRHEVIRPTSRKIYQKSETKQIEILEIMELVQPEKTETKNKSKIPVLVQPKLPKLRRDKYDKPAFLDFHLLDSDPKLDQLIANILIDSMQRDDTIKKSFVDAQIETESQVLCEDMEKMTNDKEKSFELLDNNNYLEKTADSLTKQVLENNNLETNNETQKKKQVDSSKIPKGWITFYMLQKNNSPDSTSDEGPKKATNNTKTTKVKGSKYYGPRKRLLNRDTCNDSEYKSENESDSEVEPSAFRRRHVLRENKRGWSVTVSGTGNGDKGPDVEMRLKFPDVNQTKYKPNKHTHFEQRSDVTSSFPQLVNTKNKNHLDQGLTYEDVCSNRRPTEINISKKYLKNCNSKTQIRTGGQLKFEPRHTKTSQQRCLMNRQTHKHYHRRAAAKDTNHNEIEDLLQNLPDFLVNGNAVNRDNKLVLSRICENDLKYLLSHLNKS